jgi:hypothetical protein
MAFPKLPALYPVYKNTASNEAAFYAQKHEILSFTRDQGESVLERCIIVNNGLLHISQQTV